jgi:polysaccharide pyruvyl transferase WcaK-like protein
MKHLKILVINQHTANFGDDAAGVTMATHLRHQFPDAEMHFVYNWPWDKSKFVAIPYEDSLTFHHHEIIIQKTDLKDAIIYLASKFIPFIIQVKPKTTLSAYLNLVKTSNFVIVSPGGSNIGIYRDWICLFRVLIAVLEKKETIFHLNSIGKSGNLIFDLISQFVLKKSQVFVRESKSHEVLNKWGIPNVRGVDTALSLPADSHHLLEDIKIDMDEESIIFIPTRLGSWHPLCRKINLPQKIRQDIIPSLISFAKNYNLKIYILPHLYSVLSEEKFLQDIYNTFLELGIDQEKIIFLENVETFRYYESYIAHAKIVVSMRYHGVILSIRHGIPFISLAYENKMKEACNYSEMLNFNLSLDSDELTQTALIEAYETAYQNRQEISEKLIGKQSILSELSRLPIACLYLKSLEMATFDSEINLLKDRHC